MNKLIKYKNYIISVSELRRIRITSNCLTFYFHDDIIFQVKEINSFGYVLHKIESFLGHNGPECGILCDIEEAIKEEKNIEKIHAEGMEKFVNT